MKELEPTATRSLSERGVEASARFLTMQGYEILETNWQCEAGEIPIIARKDSELCFIEVAIRSNDSALPREVQCNSKRKRFERIAIRYLYTYEETDIKVRFDEITLLVLGEGRALLRHHINCLN